MGGGWQTKFNVSPGPGLLSRSRSRSGPDWEWTWTGPGPDLGPGMGPGPELDNINISYLIKCLIPSVPVPASNVLLVIDQSPEEIPEGEM